MKIILVGFMGSGKSVVGRGLAKRLGIRFVDMDQLIVKREGKTIPQIFTEKGEPYFRQIEKRVALEVARSDSPCVIATGGGTLMDPESLDALKKAGKMIWLSVSPDQILQRTKARDSRPLLQDRDPLSKIQSLLSERGPVYAQADFTVDTDHSSVEQVIGRILTYLAK